MQMSSVSRQRKIEKITIIGSVVNLLLSFGKILAGILGRSAAMLADGVHSLSDLLSDIVVLVFVRISSKGKDKSHDYGYGKFETFATLIVSVLLLVVAAEMMASGIETIRKILNGGEGFFVGVAFKDAGEEAVKAAVVNIDHFFHCR